MGHAEPTGSLKCLYAHLNSAKAIPSHPRLHLPVTALRRSESRTHRSQVLADGSPQTLYGFFEVKPFEIICCNFAMLTV